ncbi:MAG: polysaccharide biosynthesis C-terminal domain-containing protein [Bacteroidota bacterium]
MAERSYFQDILSVFGSNMAVTASNLAIGIILSRVLGAAGYGIYSSIIVVPMIVIGLTQLGIRRATMYHIGTGKLPVDHVVSAVFILLLITSFLSIVISGLVFMFSESKTSDPFLIILVLCTIPLVLCNVYAGGIFLGNRELLRANILNSGPTLINLLFVIILVWVLKLSVKGAFLALFLGNLGMFFFVFLTIRKSYRITWKYHEGIMKSMVRLGSVFALSIFVMQLNYRVDIILLKRYSTLEQVGLYSLAMQIAEQLWHVPYAIETIILTRSANAPDDKSVHKTVASILRVSILFGLFGSLLIVVLSPPLIPLIFGKEFQGSVEMMQWILPGTLFLVGYRILNSRLAAMGKPQIAIYTFIPALVLNIVLNLLWIPKWGGMGAVWASNVSYAFGTILFVGIFSKITGMRVLEIFTFRKSDFFFFRELKTILTRKK